MRIPGRKKVRLAARWLRSRFGSRVLVLGYHRVAQVDHDPYGICVSPDALEQQLRALSKVARPLDVSTLAEDLNANRIRRGSVVVTFDDGYADLLDAALPLLHKYEIPATVFVATGSIDDEFWWDRVYRIVASTRHLSDLRDAIEAAGLPLESVVQDHREASVAKASEDDSSFRRQLSEGLYRELLRL
ncbi:MAG: polysaccharide deacetylase family protein, partial [Rhodothermales bacterium]|nr:polysaccharide deacetylase family protein [Rhodothermales bacterium]